MGPDGARPRELLPHLLPRDLQPPEDDPGPCLFLEDPCRGSSHAEQLRKRSQKHAARRGRPLAPRPRPRGPSAHWARSHPWPSGARGGGRSAAQPPHSSPQRTRVGPDGGLHVLKGGARIGRHRRQVMPRCLVTSADAITRTFQKLRVWGTKE